MKFKLKSKIHRFRKISLPNEKTLLASACIVGIGLSVISVMVTVRKEPSNLNAQKQPETSQKTQTVAQPTHNKQQLINLVNQTRKERGVAYLTENNKLSVAAQKIADQLAANPSVSLDSKKVGDIAVANGYNYGLINYRNADYAVNDDAYLNFLKSDSGSAEAMLGSSYVHIGYGISKNQQKNTNMIVVVFAKPNVGLSKNTTNSNYQSGYVPPSTYNYQNYTPRSDYSTPSSYKPYYCSTYSSDNSLAVSSENRRFNQKSAEINYAIAKIGASGAGSSSAMDQVQAMKAQNIAQHQRTLNQLQADYIAKQSACS